MNFKVSISVLREERSIKLTNTSPFDLEIYLKEKTKKHKPKLFTSVFSNQTIALTETDNCNLSNFYFRFNDAFPDTE